MDMYEIERFKRQVSGYRDSLLYFSGACQWDSFRSKAAELFASLESTEMSLLRGKFQASVSVILMALAAMLMLVTALGSVGVALDAGLRQGFLLLAVSIYALALLLLLELKLYLSIRTSHQRKRQDRFINELERDARARMGEDACTLPSW
jgi:hypothetical protein